MIHTDPRKRHDFVLLFDVKDGNPNGDPDAGNLPRFDPETRHGIVTDVALKRKIRDYAATQGGKPIFIQSKASLNSLILNAFRDEGVKPVEIPIEDEDLAEWFEQNNPQGFQLESGKLAYGGESTKERQIAKDLLEGVEDTADEKLTKKLRKVAKDLAQAAKDQGAELRREDQEKARRRLIRDYYDIRMFGAVLSTGLNAGQVRGPMQFTFARSIDPVLPLDLSITRQARTTEERMKTGTTEMARKPFVPYGLYQAHGFFNPYLAAVDDSTFVAETDLELFWEAVKNMFEFDRSAARGEMATRGIYIFTHDNRKGNAHAHRLFDLVQIGRQEKNKNEPPRSFGDYKVQVNGKEMLIGKVCTHLDDAAIPEGVTLFGKVWTHLDDAAIPEGITLSRLV